MNIRGPPFECLGQQTGTEFFLEIFHNGKSLAEVNGTMATNAAFGTPAVSKFVPLRDGLDLAKELATSHLLIVEQFCLILKGG